MEWPTVINVLNVCKSSYNIKHRRITWRISDTHVAFSNHCIQTTSIGISHWSMSLKVWQKQLVNSYQVYMYIYLPAGNLVTDVYKPQYNWIADGWTTVLIESVCINEKKTMWSLIQSVRVWSSVRTFERTLLEGTVLRMCIRYIEL